MRLADYRGIEDVGMAQEDVLYLRGPPLGSPYI